MSIRGLLVAVVLLGVLAGGAYWSERQKKAEEAKETAGGPSRLITTKDADVQKVAILHRGAPETAIERDASSQWKMVSPQPLRVDQDTANGVATAYSTLSYDRLIEEKATDLSSYGLQSPGAEITFAEKGGKTRKLLIGDETPTGGGVYAKLADDPRVFTIPSATRGSLDKSAKDLRDKRLLIFTPEKLTTVSLTAKGVPVEFGRTGENEWQIVKPKPMRADNGQVEDLVRKLSDARMDTAVSDEDAAKAPSDFAMAARIGSASVTDASGTQTIEVRKKGENYYAKSSAVDGVFRIASDAGEALNKGIEDFRNKKLFDFGFSEPSKVDIRDGATTYSFVKGGEKWWSNGKEVDPVSVQSLIDKLRELRAQKFVEAGFTTPAIDVTVTSNSGKRVEKLALAKTAAGYLAKRENDATLYDLEAKAVEDVQKAAADVKPPPPPPKK